LNEERLPHVFINCPFDPSFEELLDALFLTAIFCGFSPRMSFDTGNVAQSRMERILDAMADCEYSIHDLSRCRGGGDRNLARFNMPLELGIAMQRRFASPESHDWLVLTPSTEAYAAYISDLAGYDLSRHEETVESIVPPAMSWLITREGSVGGLEPKDVHSALPFFRARKADLRLQWGAYIPWQLLIEAASEVAPAM
jgi:hypothetical protein